MDKKLFSVEVLEDGVTSYDCLLCPDSFLEKDQLDVHITMHKETH